ncbi:MAG: hypothetical protein M3Z08_03470 [Chloroflexota bacterium]|nr:hypothetical protein [Chloroflexota bacterium]
MGYNKNEASIRRGHPDGRPDQSAHAGHPQVLCPYCDSTETELFALFGQQLLTVQYYCNACHTPFERVKDDDVLEAARQPWPPQARKEDQP